MGYNTADRVLEQTQTSGTGNITLSGVVTGYRTFGSMVPANGDIFPYVIAGGSEWEVGIGTRLSATTFSRSPTASSNAGALVNFSAGTKETWIDWTHHHVSMLRAANMIINPAMEISQENGSTAVSVSGSVQKYIVDGWAYGQQGSQVVSGAQVADAPPGFKYSLKFSVTTANASPSANNNASPVMYVEGRRAARLWFGQSYAQGFAIGFWWKSHRTGTYNFSVHNSAFNRAYIVDFNVNAVDTWEYKSFVIPPDTTGTWLGFGDSGIGLQLYFSVMAAAALQTTTGSWLASALIASANITNGVAATSDTHQITGLTLIPGVVPVPEAMSALVMPPFNKALYDSQRFYEKSYDYATALGTAVANGAITWGSSGQASSQYTVALPFRFKVPKRAPPTMTYYSSSGASGKVRDVSNASDVTPTSLNTGEKLNIAQATMSASANGFRMSGHFVADARW